MNEKPAQLATCYLSELWGKRLTGVPPLELTQAVVSTVIQVGYTRALVKKMFEAYIERVYNISTP